MNKRISWDGVWASSFGTILSFIGYRLDGPAWWICAIASVVFCCYGLSTMLFDD